MGQIGLIGQIITMVAVAGWRRSIILAVGWIIGYVLAEADHLFYVALCNPQELACQRIRTKLETRSWRDAWALMRETMGERTRLPIHNVLTGLIVAVLGLWVVSSGGSVLASGVVVGLGVRLFSEFLSDDKKKWFWVFAREFDIREVWVVGGIWGLLLIISLIGLVR